MSYNVRYTCSNCKHTGEQSFPMGTEAPNRTTCPHCGCLTATKCHTPAKTAVKTVVKNKKWPTWRCPHWLDEYDT